MSSIDRVIHATRAIAASHDGRSKLPPDVFKLPGFSSVGSRTLLNNLCAFEGCHYLEVGAFEGATAIAASYGNPGRFTAIDDFHQFGKQRECEANLEAYQEFAPVKLIVADAWTVAPESVAPVDVFFYDGMHDRLSTQRAIEYFAPALAETCVVVVDDWNWLSVRDGMHAARPDRPWYPLARWELFTADIQDDPQFRLFCQDPMWWNGIFVGVYASSPCGSAPAMS